MGPLPEGQGPGGSPLTPCPPAQWYWGVWAEPISLGVHRVHHNDIDIWRGVAGPSTEAAAWGLPARSRSHEGRSITGEADRLYFPPLIGRCQQGERGRAMGGGWPLCGQRSGSGLPLGSSLIRESISVSLPACLCVFLSSVSLHLFISPFLFVSCFWVSLYGSLSLFYYYNIILKYLGIYFYLLAI